MMEKLMTHQWAALSRGLFSLSAREITILQAPFATRPRERSPAAPL